MQRLLTLLTLTIAVAASSMQPLHAQLPASEQDYADRLPIDLFDVLPPSARVSGQPGRLTVQPQPCMRSENSQLRRRIVDIAVQEWAYFGFSIVDETDESNWMRNRRPPGSLSDDELQALRAASEARLVEAQRVADSIAGYWAATPDGSWVISSQNDAWTSSNGRQSRWVQPWSAAFISWVMCEAGLGEVTAFRRAIAHHVYIDQAISARDNGDRSAAYAAYDVGEASIAPGDMLCTARRPVYRSLAERRRQMGDGASTHCDLVVHLDTANERILAIGGNVRGTVGMKLLPAALDSRGELVPVPASRTVFAHLQLRAAVIEPVALQNSPTIASLRCNGARPSSESLANVLASANRDFTDSGATPPCPLSSSPAGL